MTRMCAESNDVSTNTQTTLRKKHYPIVTDRRVLRAMERRGFITLLPEKMSRHWSGQTVRTFYVEEVKGGPSSWEYVGDRYRLQYFDGCFFPFVVRADASPAQLPSFV